MSCIQDVFDSSPGLHTVYDCALFSVFREKGHAVAQLVEALRHKPESRGFDARWYH